jgi:hypothetical protein
MCSSGAENSKGFKATCTISIHTARRKAGRGVWLITVHVIKVPAAVRAGPQ